MIDALTLNVNKLTNTVAIIAVQQKEIPSSGPEGGKEEGNNKRASNKKNNVLTKNKKIGLWWTCPSDVMCDSAGIAPVVTVKPLDSSSKDSITYVELDSHAVITVVVSNALVIHDQDHFVNVYGFESKSRHTNMSTKDAIVAYDNPIGQVKC